MLCFHDYHDWNIPLSAGDVLVTDALASLKAVNKIPEDAPLIVKLLENPEYHLPGLTLFHGAVDLTAHDYIHVLLGRGLMPKDEAFCIGFTMGSTHMVNALEQSVFCTINKWLYPRKNRFGDEEVAIFKDGVRLGELSNCRSLDEVTFGDFDHATISGMRSALGVEEDLLKAYYRIEKQRYPDAPESQRLLSDSNLQACS